MTLEVVVVGALMLLLFGAKLFGEEVVAFLPISQVATDSDIVKLEEAPPYELEQLVGKALAEEEVDQQDSEFEEEGEAI